MNRVNSGKIYIHLLLKLMVNLICNKISKKLADKYEELYNTVSFNQIESDLNEKNECKTIAKILNIYVFRVVTIASTMYQLLILSQL